MGGLIDVEAGESVPVATPPATPVQHRSPRPTGDYLAPWIDTVNCTACDECTKLNAKIFEYDADKKAVIKNAEAGPYKDLVKAAERCTARVIHPGLPRTATKKGSKSGSSAARSTTEE